MSKDDMRDGQRIAEWLGGIDVGAGVLVVRIHRERPLLGANGSNIGGNLETALGEIVNEAYVDRVWGGGEYRLTACARVGQGPLVVLGSARMRIVGPPKMNGVLIVESRKDRAEVMDFYPNVLAFQKSWNKRYAMPGTKIEDTRALAEDGVSGEEVAHHMLLDGARLSIEPRELVGTRTLTGRGMWVAANNARHAAYTIDGVTYIFLEDPNDGLRSSLRTAYIAMIGDCPSHAMSKFDPIVVELRIGTGCDSEVLYAIDERDSSACVFYVGTTNVGDMYPGFVSEWLPGNITNEIWFPISPELSSMEDA